MTATSGDALARVLAALDGAGRSYRHQAGQHAAQCPAHEDRNPSMTVRNGEGRALLHCHAGCTTEQILDALGLDWTDLFDQAGEDRGGHPQIIATYDYRTADGTMIFQKVRMLPKTFRVRRPAGHGDWIWSIGDAPRVLYRLPEVLAAVAQGRTVYVVEGEKDADRLARLGEVATTNFEGAAEAGQRPKWRPEYSDPLAGGHVRVIADNDAAGIAHARAVAASLTGKAASVELLRPALDVPKSDVSDHLAAGLGLDDLVPVEPHPPVVTPGGNGPGAPLPPDLLTELHDGAWLDAQTFPPLTYAVPGVIPEGSTLLVGPPKIGKSWFVLACALAIACGGRALGVVPVHKRPVLYLALEDGHRRLQSRCRILLGDDPIPPAFEYLTTIAPGQVLATIEAWMARHLDAAPLVILDTLGKVMPPALPGESAYQRDYRIGSALKRLADCNPGSSLLVNHHDRKADSDDFVDSVSGTHGLAGAADTVIILNRPRLEPAGLLKITGRDIAEGEYAVIFTAESAWTLDGDSLSAAAGVASQRRAAAGVGDRSAEILAFVGEYPDGVRASEVERSLGSDARRYLARLVDSGRLIRLSRGLYRALQTPVPTVPMSQEPLNGMGHWDSGDTPTGDELENWPAIAEGYN